MRLEWFMENNVSWGDAKPPEIARFFVAAREHDIHISTRMKMPLEVEIVVVQSHDTPSLRQRTGKAQDSVERDPGERETRTLEGSEPHSPKTPRAREPESLRAETLKEPGSPTK